MGAMTAEDLLVPNLIAIVPLSILGSLLHFAFDWSRHNRVVAVFAAVNESYWEHVKIAVWPVALWFVVQFAFGGWQVRGFVPAATIALYVIPVAMIALVFAYKRFARRNILWADILSFAVAVALSLVVFALLAAELQASGWTIAVSVVFLAVLVGAFLRYTLNPPAEPDLFVDPTNSRYGLHAHPDA